MARFAEMAVSTGRGGANLCLCKQGRITAGRDSWVKLEGGRIAALYN